MVLGTLGFASAMQRLAGEETVDLGHDLLINGETPSHSRKSQTLSKLPAATFVISSEDIVRSAAKVLPNVLRMVHHIEVMQIDRIDMRI